MGAYTPEAPTRWLSRLTFHRSCAHGRAHLLALAVQAGQFRPLLFHLLISWA